MIIYGSGGHGAVVAEVAEAAGYHVLGFVDDNIRLTGSKVLDWHILGGPDKVDDGANVALAIGDNSTRARLLALARKRLWHLPAIIHPSAAVSRSAVIDEAVVIMANAVVNARARIGPACILNTACSVDHDCDIGGLVHMAPGSRLGGEVGVGTGSLIGIGSCVRPSVRIGDLCVIGAGSTVVSDIPNEVTAYGNPAKVRT